MNIYGDDVKLEGNFTAMNINLREIAKTLNLAKNCQRSQKSLKSSQDTLDFSQDTLRPGQDSLRPGQDSPRPG
jgi:hypothetical protein